MLIMSDNEEKEGLSLFCILFFVMYNYNGNLHLVLLLQSSSSLVFAKKRKDIMYRWMIFGIHLDILYDKYLVFIWIYYMINIWCLFGYII